MSFVKKPFEVNRALMVDKRVPVIYRVYGYLSMHCDYETGILHRLSASDIAEAVDCNRRSVDRALHELRERQWLLGGDTLLSGYLVGFRSRPYKSSKPRHRRPPALPPDMPADIPFAGNGDGNGTGTKSSEDVLWSPAIQSILDRN